MNIENTSKKAAEVIGIICTVCFMLTLWVKLDGSLVLEKLEIFNPDYHGNIEYPYLFCGLLSGAGIITITMGIFAKRPMVLLPGVLLKIFEAISRFILSRYTMVKRVDRLHYIIELFAIIILAFIVLTIAVPKIRTMVPFVNNLGLLSAALFAIRLIYSIVPVLKNELGYKSIIEPCFYYSIELLSFILLSLWLYFICNSTAPKKAVEKAQNNDAVSVNSLELLTSYKELLDQGAITQEEFDAKRKSC